MKRLFSLFLLVSVAIAALTLSNVTFGTPRMVRVSGDVGKDVSTGNAKSATWDVMQDGDSLQLDSGCFRVAAVGGSNKQTFNVEDVRFTMIFVEGGTFTMGCTSEQGDDCWDDEKPAHKVTLSDYYIGETEVTQELWTAVMDDNPSYFKGDNLPVEKVSYDDVQTFISRLNQKTFRTFRMPTEAEWEYAARGGKKSRGYKYSGSNTIGDVAWYDGNSGSRTHPVKQKQANELGIYDMCGNVWEWCSDWKGDYGGDSQTNPTGPYAGSGRVRRGGSWGSKAWICRVSNRNYYFPSYRDNYFGFRLALIP